MLNANRMSVILYNQQIRADSNQSWIFRRYEEACAVALAREDKQLRHLSLHNVCKKEVYATHHCKVS